MQAVPTGGAEWFPREWACWWFPQEWAVPTGTCEPLGQAVPMEQAVPKGQVVPTDAGAVPTGGGERFPRVQAVLMPALQPVFAPAR